MLQYQDLNPKDNVRIFIDPEAFAEQAQRNGECVIVGLLLHKVATT